jgi:hypothetical protein
LDDIVFNKYRISCPVKESRGYEVFSQVRDIPNGKVKNVWPYLQYLGALAFSVDNGVVTQIYLFRVQKAFVVF